MQISACGWVWIANLLFWTDLTDVKITKALRINTYFCARRYFWKRKLILKQFWNIINNFLLVSGSICDDEKFFGLEFKIVRIDIWKKAPSLSLYNIDAHKYSVLKFVCTQLILRLILWLILWLENAEKSI